MNKKLTTLLASLAILGALVGARLQTQENRYVVYRGFNAQVMKTLELQGEKMHWEGRNLILTTHDKDHLLSSLSIAAEGQEQSVRVYYQNLGNRNTLNGSDGHPYRRFNPVFSDDSGLFCGVVVEDSDYFWVYKPEDPHALASGPHAGQVAYPNVCAARENILLMDANEQIRKLATVMSEINSKTAGPGSGGMFALYNGSDPFTNLPNNQAYAMMSTPAIPPAGHQCTAECIGLPEDIPVLKSSHR